MEEIFSQMIQPELLAMVPALCFLGVLLKRSDTVKDERIPRILGIAGILIAAIWVFGQNTPRGFSEIMNAVFTSLVQGLLCAGASVYLHQLVHQRRKLQSQGATQTKGFD